MEPNSTESEVPAAPEQTEMPVGAPDPEFQKKIEESRATIRRESERRRSGKKKPKRGRGRPRKDPAPTVEKTEVAAPTAAAEVVTSSALPEIPNGIDLSKYLVQPAIMISRIPARKVGIPELALTNDEATAFSASLVEFMNAWIPDTSKLSPKAAAAIGLGLTCATIAQAKWEIYDRVQAERRGGQQPAAPETAPAGVADIPDGPPVAAGAYFPGRHV